MTNPVFSGTPEEPKSVKVFITPEMAAEWLDKNTHNRLINDRYVGDLARDMTNGAWDLNGEAIKIATDWTILDGQHRLLAIVLSGVGVWSFVVTNLDPNTQKTMDGGRKRTHGDRYRIDRETNPNVLAAIVRGAWKWERGDRRLSTNPSPTKAEMDTLLDAHPRLRRSVEIGMRSYAEFRFIPPTAVGIAHFVLTGISPELAPEFFQRVMDGAGLEKFEPIWTLRKRAMSDKEARIKPSTTTHVGYLLYTWNHHMKRLVNQDYTLGKFVYTGTDGIPVPRVPWTAQTDEPVISE